MPATLPWPKIAQHPATIGSVSPSITVICLARNRTSACATVSRTVLSVHRHFPPDAAFAVVRRPSNSTSRALSVSAVSAALFERQPEIDQRAELSRPCRRPPASSPISPSSQRSAASAKIVRPTAKPRTDLAVARGGEALLQRLDRRLEAEQHDAAAVADRARRSRRRSPATAATDACGSSFHQSGLRPAS